MEENKQTLSFAESPNQNALGKNKYFDPIMGMVGGLIMGGIVYIINSDHGVGPALIAAAKQTTYTFFAAGVTMKLSENLATYPRNRQLANLASVVIPTIVTVGLTYVVHSLKGTPEPFESTIPAMILSPLGFIWWNYKKRKQQKAMLAVAEKPNLKHQD